MGGRKGRKLILDAEQIAENSLEVSGFFEVSHFLFKVIESGRGLLNFDRLAHVLGEVRDDV